MDPELLAWWVRLTARASALIFCAALLAYPRQRLATSFIGALVAMHTVHFAFVVGYAQTVGGRNIAERGGWLHALAIALIFYAAAMHVAVRGWRRRRAALPWRSTETAGLLLIGAFFVSSYSGRVMRDPFFAPLGALLVLSLAWFVRWRWLARRAAVSATTAVVD